MNPRIGFAIISAFEREDAVTQLVDAIGPQHPIVIHHDFTKQPGFRIRRPNVQFVANPLVTKWGSWEFTEAIRLAMRTLLRNCDIDYFQLLSGSCLPIQPIESFESFVTHAACDVNMDLLCIDEDHEAMMSHGFRLFAATDSFRQRLLRRTRRWYYDNGACTVQRSGLGIRTRTEEPMPSGMPTLAYVARAFTQFARQGYMFKHPYGQIWLPYIGSTWFGCKPEAAEFIAFRPDTDPVVSFMKRATCSDELFFQTLIGNSPFSIGPSNHLINDFEDAHPQVFDYGDLARIRASKRFFARKFPLDPTNPVRSEVLGREEAIYA